LEKINVGDRVIYTSDIKSIIQTYFNDLIIKVPVYEVLEIDKPNDLYYYIKNIETGQGSFILKQYIVKIDE
jgi:hypothetical protein